MKVPNSIVLALVILLIQLLVSQPPIVAALSSEQKALYNQNILYYDLEACDDGGLAVSGKISPNVGNGLSASTKEKMQQVYVAAGKKFNVDPNFVATFYYIENVRTGDSTNNADSASGTPVTGDGKWRDPAPPYGNGPSYGTSTAAAQGPHQFIPSTWEAYAVDGDGDGKADVLDLTDAAFGAAKYLGASGASGTTNEADLRRAAFAYNHSDTYVQSALNTFKYLSGGKQGDVSGSGASCDDQTVTGNFVFPVKATKSDYGAGYSSALTKPTCKNPSGESVCHHDYFAADLGPREGFTVLAVTAGTVRQVTDPGGCDGSGDAPRIHVEGTNGQWFFYQHLKPGSIEVKVGDKVNAGDELAKIGPSPCAQNTPAHLHFDMTKDDAPNSYFSRPGPDADKYLVDPMPQINRSYNKLPDS